MSISLIPSLGFLYVTRCQKLVFLKENEVNLGINAESGREVVVEACEALKSYNCPNNIKKLSISNCVLMTSLTFPVAQDLPSPLKIIEVENCENLEDSWLRNNFLSSLGFHACHNMRSFPEKCFFSYHHIENLGL